MKLNNVTLKQIRYFCAVADAGSFSSAASALHVSQPAVGMQIVTLEKDLKSELLIRGPRGVRLTPAGAAFLQHSRRVLAALEDAGRSILEFADKSFQEVIVGVTPTAGRVLFDDLISGAAVSGTPFRISLIEALSEVLLAKLRAKELQCAFCYDVGSNKSWESFPIFEEAFCLVGRPDIVCAKEIRFHELPDYPLALGPRGAASRRAISRAASAAGVRLNVQVEIAPISLKRELLIRKGVCAIVPYGLFLADIEAGTLGAARIRPEIRRRMNLLVRRSLDPAVRRELVSLAQSSALAQIKAGCLGWCRPE